MQLTAQQTVSNNNLLANVNSFLIWSFVLIVCFLVVGFPLVFLLTTIGVLMTIVLQGLIPISSVFLVGSSLISFSLLIMFVSAAALTIKGIRPQDVTWLSWLHGDAELHYDRVYASCPLTCSIAK